MVDLQNLDSKSNLVNELDALLESATNQKFNPESYVPGIVAGFTDNKQTKYLQAAGVRDQEIGDQIEKDAIFPLFSCTKSIVATGVLLLWERGIIDLDEPVKTYLPRIEKVGVIKGINDGKPIIERPQTEITMKMLLTHTSGFAYPFFNEFYDKFMDTREEPLLLHFNESTFDNSFLVFEPGTQWTYGIGIDWAGKVIEAVTGKTLGQYLKESIFEPARMNSCTFHILDDYNRARIVPIYTRDANGVKKSEYQLSSNPEVDLGGHGLFGTVEDYLKYIRIWINEGTTSEGVQIFKPETYQYAIKNHLPENTVLNGNKSYQKFMSEDLVFEDNEKWNLAFCLNDSDRVTGRPKGSFFWSGITNLYYWIDPKNKVGGFYASEIWPSGDVSAQNFDEMERIVYKYIS